MEILRGQNVVQYVDPERRISAGPELKTNNTKPSAKDLVVRPELWNMSGKEDGVELRELLRHFTIFAPFKGRPFIRALFETLVPCFCR